MRPLAASIGLIALVAGAGCSLLFDVDAREYGGGVRADAAGDAAGLSGDAAGPSGDAAGPSGDAAGPSGDAAGPSGDAARDALTDAGTDAASPCRDGGYLFCDDFDDDASLAAHGWNGSYVTGAAYLGHDTAAFLSPPNALLARTNAREYASAAVHFDGVDPVGKLRVDFDLRVEQIPTDSTAIATLGVGSYSLRFGVLPDAHFWEDEWENSTGEIGSAHVLGATAADWTHVTIVLQFVANQASGSHATIVIGGDTAYDAPASPSVAGGTPNISVGVIDAPNASCRNRVDNLIVTR